MESLTFKVQLTPTQSERFQKEVFAKGGTWAIGKPTVILTQNPFMILNRGKMSSTDEDNERHFQCYSAPEVLTEQAFSLVEKASQMKKPGQKQTDKFSNQGKIPPGLALATLIKNLDVIHAAILDMEDKARKGE